MLAAAGDEFAERRGRPVAASPSLPDANVLHLRGGAHEPLTRQDIEVKFMLNARHGGWDEKRSQSALRLLRKLYDGRIDLKELRG